MVDKEQKPIDKVRDALEVTLDMCLMGNDGLDDCEECQSPCHVRLATKALTLLDGKVLVERVPTVTDTDKIAKEVSLKLEQVWKENGYRKPVPKVSSAMARYCIESYLTAAEGVEDE